MDVLEQGYDEGLANTLRESMFNRGKKAKTRYPEWRVDTSSYDELAEENKFKETVVPNASYVTDSHDLLKIVVDPLPSHGRVSRASMASPKLTSSRAGPSAANTASIEKAHLAFASISDALRLGTPIPDPEFSEVLNQAIEGLEVACYSQTSSNVYVFRTAQGVNLSRLPRHVLAIDGSRLQRW